MSYTRPTQRLAALSVAVVLLSVTCVVTISLALAQEAGQRACCCVVQR